MQTILDQIVRTKWQEIAAARALIPELEVEKKVNGLSPCRDFTSALCTAGQLHVIAEVKKASPSAGVLREDFDPARIAKTYQTHGATCISVLTDRVYFQGDLKHLSAVRAAVDLPLLRKDFIIDRYQLLKARERGADAVLLIAEILPGEQLRKLYRQAEELGLHILVELHDAVQLPRVLDCGAKLVGINNRDLRSFSTRLEHTLELMSKIPPSICVVSESGIKTRDDMDRLAAAGVRAVLVGETLMKAPDIGLALDELRGVNPPSSQA